jgi:hypothetical protein
MVDTPVTNTGSSTSSAPTVADLYGTPGALDQSVNDAYKGQEDAYSPAGVQDQENQSRSDVLSQYQSQVDAIDQAAAAARARITSQLAPIAANAAGEQTAINARRGLGGSDFGAASSAAVNNQNETNLQDKISASDATYATQKQNLLQFIQGEADKEATTRIDASQKGADAKVAEIQARQTRAQASAQASVQAMIANGITDPSNPNYATGINAIATNTGLSKDQVTALYTTEKQAEDAATLKAKQDTATLANTTATTAKTQAETAATLTPEEVAQEETDKHSLDQSTIAKNNADIKAESITPDDLNSFASTLSDYGGQKYITPTDLEGYSTAQKNAIATAAKGAGIPTLSAKDSDALNAIQDAKSNLEDFSQFIAPADQGGTGVLPSTSGIFGLGAHPAQYANVKLNDFFQANPQLGSFNSWQAQIIPLITALKGAGSGGGGASRMFNSISALLPVENDTLPTAQAKIKNIQTILDNGAKSILPGNSGQSQAAAPSVGDTITNADGIPDGTTAQGDDGKTYVAQGGQWVAQ